VIQPSRDPADALAHLPAIGLSDVLDEAPFLTRADRKYLVPASILSNLLAGVDERTRVLEIEGRRTFAYQTPYFDDDDLSAYFGALRRRPHRYKVRTRLYVDSGLCLLELKLRDGRGRTVKHRIAHEPGTLERLSPGERAWLRGFPQVGRRAGCLRHRLTTWYRRSTLVLPEAAGRVTIDRDLTFSLPCGEALTLPALAIVETKGAGKPTSFDRLLWRNGYRPRSMSKFTAGLSLLAPDLPANRWHRVRERLIAEAEPIGIGA
jgi:hypothetical protein